MRAHSSTGWTSGAATYDGGVETHNCNRPAPRCSALLSGLLADLHLVPSPVAFSRSQRARRRSAWRCGTAASTRDLQHNHAQYDNPGIAMLATLGEQFGNPHNWIQFTSDAGRATASVVWPGSSAVAECITPGGNCDKTNLALAAVPLPSWSKLTVDIEHLAERHMAGGALTG